MMGRLVSRLRWIVLAIVVAFPVSAHADAVDDSFALGNEAAARQDWEAAAQHYEEAAALLPGRSSLLSYNLGTAYAQLGDLGRATYHLRRALDFRGGPTTEITEAARSNLETVRRRVELSAATNGTRVDRPETWWDLFVEALEAPGVGWLALVSGWAFLVVLWVHRRRGLAGRSRSVTGATLVVLGLCYLVPGLLHAWAERADRENPEAIVLGAQVDAREGPGNHRAVEFSLQGGARVRIVERTPGWMRVRLPGGIEGWVPEQTIGELGRPKGSALAPQRRAAKPDVSKGG
jgi:hypothetical protein